MGERKEDFVYRRRRVSTDRAGTMAELQQSKMHDSTQSFEVLKILIQKDQDNSQKLALEVKHHEDNLKYLMSQVNTIDESIHHLQGKLKEFHFSCMDKGDSNPLAYSEKQVNNQIRLLDKTAAGVICEVKDRHSSMLSTLKCAENAVGIVALLGRVSDENLNRMLSEYLGLEKMLAIVVQTMSGIEGLENYEQDGTINLNAGLHGVAPTIGRILNGRFLVYCLENLRPFGGELLPNDPQRKLALLNPKLPNGKFPSGFLGYAVNMIYVDEQHLSSLTASGRGLRETLFFALLSHLQVYNTRSEMIGALPFISHGAISLDGGMIKGSGLFCLGDRTDVGIRFPILNGKPNDLEEEAVAEIEEKIKSLEWKKQMLSSDMKREEALINNVKCVLRDKSNRYKKLVYDDRLNTELKSHISSNATSLSG